MRDIKIKEFIDKIIEVYGVNSYLDNEDEEDMWVECPECGEPILIPADFTLEEVKHECPICGYTWELED